MIPLAQSTLDKQITISVTVEQIIAWLIVGLVAGLLASLFSRGRMSMAGILTLGLVGALVGGFLFFDLLNINVTGTLAEGILIRWIDIVVAFVGSVIVLAFTGIFYRRRR